MDNRASVAYFECKNDWIAYGVVYFERGKSYKGKYFNDRKSVKMYGDSRMKVDFHVGSDYFDI